MKKHRVMYRNVGDVLILWVYDASGKLIFHNKIEGSVFDLFMEPNKLVRFHELKEAKK